MWGLGMWSLRFRDVEFRVSGLGFRVQGVGMWSLGFRAWECGVQGVGMWRQHATGFPDV